MPSARTMLVSALTCLIGPLGLHGCKFKRVDEEVTAPTGLVGGVRAVSIEPPPDHLRGRVALAAGARIYARPFYASPGWTVTLPDPPLSGGDDIPRSTAFRVVGIVRADAASLGGPLGGGDFVAVTNDLDGEDTDPASGCGAPVDAFAHLRLLVYVPIVHLSPATTKPLEVEGFSSRNQLDRLILSAGVRVGALQQLQGLPTPPDGAHWRSIDADGIRTLAAIPDDAVGIAWDPDLVPDFDDAGEALYRDAEGSTIWLRDDGGESVELTVRNACGEQRQSIREPAEIESLRALALDAFYDQRPRAEPQPVVEPAADYRIPAGTPLRWTDGDLAAETLSDWSVVIGIGQTWDGRRCFPLTLGGELVVVDAPALACVDPSALELLTADAGFETSDELELGGSIEIGPALALDGSSWAPEYLRNLINSRYDSVSECLRPLLLDSAGLIGARWDLRLTVLENGRVDAVEVDARGHDHEPVEDCLRAEAFTWLLPEGLAGRLEVPVVVGQWSPELEAEAEPEPEPKPKPKNGSTKPKSKPSSDPERGKVIVIGDDDEATPLPERKPKPDPEPEPEWIEPEADPAPEWIDPEPEPEPEPDE